MNNFNKILLIILIFFSSIKFASANDQVAFIDIDYIIKNSNIGKETLEKINKLDEENIKKLKAENKKLKEQEIELKNKENIISSEAFEEEVKKLRKKIKMYSNEKNIMVKNLSQFKKVELDKVFKKIGPIVSKYMEKNSITMVFDTKNMFINKNQIIDLLPHREPMLLIDELYDIKKLSSATAVVNVKKDSFFVQGHFPNQPVMPGVLIVESFGQAAAALTAQGLDKSTYENKLVFLMGVEKARFRNPVVPDCKLLLKIEAIRSHGRVWKYKGEAFVNEVKMADAIWSATIVDRK